MSGAGCFRWSLPRATGAGTNGGSSRQKSLANTLSPDEKDTYKIVRAVRDLFEGRSNAVGSFTLTPSAGSTTVTARNCGAGSTVLPFAKTANAAAEIGNGTMYIGAVNNGSFVVTHANNAQADRTFLYVALG